MNRHTATLAWLALCLILVLPVVSYADEGSAVRDAAPAGPSCPANTANPSITAPAGSEPIFLAARWCCLDEWQPGPCPSSKRYASMCTNACSTCGAFSCISNTTPCLK